MLFEKRFSFSKMDIFTRGSMHQLLKQGVSKTQIAKIIGVHRSTIYRELKKYSANDGTYDPFQAQMKAMNPRKRGTVLECENNSSVRDFVIEKLHEGWSPRQISGFMEKSLGHRYINHETIYRFIYSKTGKKLQLYKYLRTKRKRRYPKVSRKKRSVIPNRVLITERPKHINNRQEFGHWECDLVMFKKGEKTNLITMRERKSRKIIAIKNPSRKCKDVLKSIQNYFYKCNYQKKYFKSITFDNGTEFTIHEKIGKHLNNSKTYFCEPYKSYQKGAIENANKQLREYFPRDCNIQGVDQEEINKIVDRINNRPMACLDYEKPNEAFIGLTKRAS